jgi:hypothetical protein
MHYLPERKRVRFTKRHLGPLGTWWLKEPVQSHVSIVPRTEILDARPDGSKAVLTLRTPDGVREVITDHVIAGTGYNVDIDRLPFLDPQLAAGLARIESAPRLNHHFESSTRGLYFIGPTAAYSFGPLLRFVCGAAFAAPRVARHLARTRTSVQTGRYADESVAVGRQGL